MTDEAYFVSHNPAPPTVRVVGLQGQTEVNHSGFRAPFVLREHGGFDVPEIVAVELTKGVAGFVRAPLSEADLLIAVGVAAQKLKAGPRRLAILRAVSGMLDDDVTPA